MKKILLIAAAALLSLAASAQVKIGYVNFAELVQLMPEADAARASYQALQADAAETYNTMIAEYQSKAQAFEQNQSTWAPSIREVKSNELQRIVQTIQEYEQTAGSELQQRQNELMAPIYQKAQETVKALSKEMGLTVLFDASSALYFDENVAVDLTKAAREKLGIPADRTLESLQAEMAAQAQAAQQQ